jgi:hypothetical protein
MSTCPRCEKELEQETAYCPHCGAPLSQVAPPPPPPPPPPADEISQAEWRAYLGKNADYYLPQFARFSLGGVERFVATWHWPAFLSGGLWFLYRKLYLWFIVALAGFFVFPLALLVAVAAGVCANYIYFTEARKQILALRRANPGQDILPILGQIGGVHAWVPPVAGIVGGAYFLLMFLLTAWMGIKIFGLLLGPFLAMFLAATGQRI